MAIGIQLSVYKKKIFIWVWRKKEKKRKKGGGGGGEEEKCVNEGRNKLERKGEKGERNKEWG